jgi:hypothetical protein
VQPARAGQPCWQLPVLSQGLAAWVGQHCSPWSSPKGSQTASHPGPSCGAKTHTAAAPQHKATDSCTTAAADLAGAWHWALSRAHDSRHATRRLRHCQTHNQALPAPHSMAHSLAVCAVPLPLHCDRQPGGAPEWVPSPPLPIAQHKASASTKHAAYINMGCQHTVTPAHMQHSCAASIGKSQPAVRQSLLFLATTARRQLHDKLHTIPPRCAVPGHCEGLPLVQRLPVAEALEEDRIWYYVVRALRQSTDKQQSVWLWRRASNTASVCKMTLVTAQQRLRGMLSCLRLTQGERKLEQY